MPNCDGFPDQCGDACTDLDIDPLNCGDCGNTCSNDEVCANGECQNYVPAPGCDSCPCDNCVGDVNNCCESDLYGGVICIDGGDCPP